MNPRVKSVIPVDDFKLRLKFDNGESREYDCSHLLEFGVFKELRDVNYFRQAQVKFGTVVWPNEQDICPDTVYLDSVKSPTCIFQASESSSQYED